MREVDLKHIYKNVYPKLQVQPKSRFSNVHYIIAGKIIFFNSKDVIASTAEEDSITNTTVLALTVRSGRFLVIFVF